MKTLIRIHFIFLLLSIPTAYLFSTDNIHLYKAPRFEGEQSFNSSDWLTQIDAFYAYGNTSRGRNAHDNTVSLLDIYGNHNLLYLTENVAQPTNLDANLKTIIDNLDTKRAAFEADTSALKALRSNFGLVEFTGKFEINDFAFTYKQNLIKRINYAVYKDNPRELERIYLLYRLLPYSTVTDIDFLTITPINYKLRELRLNFKYYIDSFEAE